jgi:hypothetical protein
MRLAMEYERYPPSVKGADTTGEPGNQAGVDPAPTQPN